VIVVDYQIPKISAVDMTYKLLQRKERAAIIILAPDHGEDRFIDEVVTGQVQYLSGSEKISVFNHHITRALNWIAHEDKSIYHLRFLSPNEALIKEGDRADYVYILKSGELRAYKSEGEGEVLLGFILPGEFVGEMA